MARPVTLFTGQWADLPLEELAPLAKEMGYDGLELACWGDHFEVNKALEDDGYVERQREILERNGLERFAVGNHLVGQAVCDPIDARHRATLPQHVWADGDPEGVRRRAAEEMKNTARAAVRLGVNVVTGFTGSSVWHKLYFFPPTSQEEVDEGYRDFAERWNPILDVFGDHRRGWDFRSVGRGTVDFEAVIRSLNRIGYGGPLSVEWEDAGMDRVHGATESAAFVRGVDFAP